MTETTPSDFDLIITADSPDQTADMRLLDGHGNQLDYRLTDFKTIPVGRQQGLFNLREYLGHYVEPGQEAASVAEIGVCIAAEVLGADISGRLWASQAQRTLRIQLPGAAGEDNPLAAALARVPWEMARPALDQPTLAQRNLVVRVVHDMAEPATQPLDLEADECLRVLFVFAEARGSRPLAARRERQELLELFTREIYPERRIEANFLTHGVTRERLEDQITNRGGYHLVHWSGHGHLNLLELAGPGGAQDLLSGQELLDLFSRAGGFIPRLFFLSACHSGDILRVQNWNEFLAAARGQKPGAQETPAGEGKDLLGAEQPGYTGTAHALLQGGVPSVLAMRYAVGDDYARDLGVEFYRALLAQEKPKGAAAALSLARKALQDARKHDPSRYTAADHATPVLYGAAHPGLSWPPGRSPCLKSQRRRLQQISELTGHQHFVGRTWELAGLGADFIGARAGAEVKPVAVITGLGGMGKTALAAEALELWEDRFEWVLLYQAKPNALGFEATLRDLDLRLREEQGRYYEQVQFRPAEAIFRPADKDFTGRKRLERLTENLVRALQDEAILLVLDNFETNLKPEAEPGAGEPIWACQDPAWDACMAGLATGLTGTRSRVLITCRKPLAALAGTPCHRVRLGPLLPAEAALYLREHPELSRLVFGGDEAERQLAQRLLAASRFHPLLLDRLARLATGGPALREQLLKALKTLEQSRDFSLLPDLFATRPGDTKELAYLEDALAASIDQLIAGADPEARRLLWVIAVANEPVTLGLLQGVWRGESPEQEQLRRLKQMLEMLPLLPPEVQEHLQAMPPKLRAEIEALPPEPPARPDVASLLARLTAVGLATQERFGPEEDDLEISCHEVVRKRLRAWMGQRPEEPGELTENAIRLAYAALLEAAFQALLHQNMTAALEAGRQAIVYCVQAGAYERLGDFASGVVTSASDPVLLQNLWPSLEAAAQAAPEGPLRWKCLCNLADALRLAGRPEASLPKFEVAAAQARTATGAPGAEGRRAWADLAGISGNWANALAMTGDLEGARQRHLESAAAEEKAGSPAIAIIANELEALRLDILQGRAAAALSQVEERLLQVEAWWRRQRAGEWVPEAPDPEVLARTFIGGLDVARAAHYAQEDWEAALGRIEASLEVKQELKRPASDLAATRGNRAVVLGSLKRFREARAELEAILPVFQDDPAGRARVLSSLADLFAAQGDVGQAITQERRALALREQLADPRDRAISHHNLALYLQRRGTPADRAEAPRHQLAALVYRLEAGLGQHLQTSLLNYAIGFRQAQAAGETLTVPRVADLLTEPAFRPLAAWLQQRGEETVAVQASVVDWLEEVRRAALGEG